MLKPLTVRRAAIKVMHVGGSEGSTLSAVVRLSSGSIERISSDSDLHPPPHTRAFLPPRSMLDIFLLLYGLQSTSASLTVP